MFIPQSRHGYWPFWNPLNFEPSVLNHKSCPAMCNIHQTKLPHLPAAAAAAGCCAMERKPLGNQLSSFSRNWPVKAEVQCSNRSTKHASLKVTAYAHVKQPCIMHTLSTYLIYTHYIPHTLNTDAHRHLPHKQPDQYQRRE